MGTPTNWKPENARQAEALARSEFEVGLGAERGGGKSEIGRVWIGADDVYTKNPMFRCLVLRKNSVDLDDWIFRFKAMFPHIDVGGNPTKLRFPAGGMGTLGHLANKDSWSHYVGHEYHKMLIEELNLIPDEQRYLMLLGSCRSTIPELKPQVMSTFNPGNVGHFWCKKRFVDCCDGKTFIDPKSQLSRILIRLKLRENNKLPREYEQTLRLLPPAIQKAWLDGDWNALAGLMFTSMPEKEQPRKFENQRLYGSFDFGSSETGHSSFGMWHIDDTNIPHRIFTWYHRLGHTAGEQALDLHDYVRSFTFTDGQMPIKVFADPAIFAKNREIGIDAQPRSVADYFIDKGFKMEPAINNRMNGWVVVADYFGIDPITKLPKCYMFDGYNSTFEEYFQMQVRDPDNPMDIAANDYDHVCDETRYGLTAFRSLFVAKKEQQKPQPQTGILCGVFTHNSQHQHDSWMR